MGKVTITEPIKGEALTATKLNSTIASWTTESTNINDENVHDQSLEHYNFADNSVRKINTDISRGTPLISQFSLISGPSAREMKVYQAEGILDFTNDDHIFRGSFNINAYPDISSVTITNAYFTITTELLYNVGVIPGTKREIKYVGLQLNRGHLDETISYAVHLNNRIGLLGDQLGFKVRLSVKIHTNAHVNMGSDNRVGVYGYFAEVETIKR